MFAKSSATEKTFEIKLSEDWRGDKFKDIHDQLHKMFDDILDKARGNAKDLCRVVVHHGGLVISIVVPL